MLRGRRRRRSRSVHSDCVGWVIEPRKPKNRRGRAGRKRRRQHVRSRYARGCRSAVVEDPITHEQTASEPGRPRLARSRAQRSRAAAGRRGADAAAEQARGRTSLVVPMKRPNKAARSGGGGRGGKGARSEGWQTTGDAPGTEPDKAYRARRLPADRPCAEVSAPTRSRSTSGRSPVRESRTPGSVRGAGSNPCPYRDQVSAVRAWGSANLRVLDGWICLEFLGFSRPK